MRIVYWGTYDLGKPRNRILLRGLRENGVELIECHADVWSDIEDKSRVIAFGQRLRLLVRWLFCYPRLVVMYLRLPRHDVVVVGYLGQIDVLVLWPFARLRGAAIVWDAFLSLYNTVVEDRELLGRRHPLALLLYALDWLACRAANRVVLDTRAHADYFAKRYGLPATRTAVVPVGAETDAFPPRPRSAPDAHPGIPATVLFYGQFIPLHGIETVVRAARVLADDPVEWVLIGRGQEEPKIRRMLDDQPLPKLRWIPWVNYHELAGWIHRSDLCLGIFGMTEKAAMVIPNKVFQILATGTPLITRDSPAIRELVTDEAIGVYLVPPADPASLADAVRRCLRERPALASESLHAGLRDRIEPLAVGRRLAEVLEGAVRNFPTHRS